MGTTSRDELRALVDALPEQAIPEAIALLKHIEDNEPLSARELENLESGRDDIRDSRMIPLEEYERQRGL